MSKLLVFMVENHSFDAMREQMTWTFDLSEQYGYTTEYRALTHPSLPNYLAIAGGSLFDIEDDHPPDQNRVAGESVFGQALALGRTARVYAEGMPENCAAEDGGAADRAREPGETADGTTAAEPEQDPAVTRLRALLERRLVEAEATTAVLAARGVPQLLLPAILPMLGVVEEDGQPRVRVIGQDGRPREDAEGRPLAVAALVDELARSEIYGRAFDGRGKTGSGTPATGQGADVATISLSDPAALGRHLADIAAGRVRVPMPGNRWRGRAGAPMTARGGRSKASRAGSSTPAPSWR